MVPQLVPLFKNNNMTQKQKLFAKAQNSIQNFRFSDLCKLAELVGCVFKRQTSSHKMYGHPKKHGHFNFQNFNGKAKPYQIRELLNFIEENNLIEERE